MCPCIGELILLHSSIKAIAKIKKGSQGRKLTSAPLEFVNEVMLIRLLKVLLVAVQNPKSPLLSFGMKQDFQGHPFISGWWRLKMTSQGGRSGGGGVQRPDWLLSGTLFMVNSAAKCITVCLNMSQF